MLQGARSWGSAACRLRDQSQIRPRAASFCPPKETREGVRVSSQLRSWRCTSCMERASVKVSARHLPPTGPAGVQHPTVRAGDSKRGDDYPVDRDVVANSMTTTVFQAVSKVLCGDQLFLSSPTTTVEMYGRSKATSRPNSVIVHDPTSLLDQVPAVSHPRP